MSIGSCPQRIQVTAVVMLDDRGRICHVRKRGTTAFMFPGGKPAPGETPEETGQRELAEELSVTVPLDALVPVGQRVTPAANEDGAQLYSDVVLLRYADWTGQNPTPSSEIEELTWLDFSREGMVETERALAVAGRTLAPLSQVIAEEFRSMPETFRIDT